MASAVATPLERQFGRIAAVSEMTSQSYLGQTSVALQFDLNRNIDAAARDVQAAINGARGYLPANLPGNPTYRKVNPADSPIFMIAMTSDVFDRGAMYDAGSSIVSQKLAQRSRKAAGARERQRAARRPRRVESDGFEQIRNRLRGCPHGSERRERQYAEGPFFGWEADVGGRRERPVIQGRKLSAADYRLSQRIGRARLRRRQRHRFGRGYPQRRFLPEQAGGADVRLQTTRRQHHRNRGSDPCRASATPGGHSTGHEARRWLRSNANNSRFRKRCGDRADCFGDPGDPGRFHNPEKIAVDRHSQRRGAGVAARNVRSDVPVQLQHRQPFVDGVNRVHRFRGGRRDRGYRKHYALSGARPEAIPGRATWRGRDRFHRDQHERFAGGGVYSLADDGRNRRPPVPRVRSDPFRRDRRFPGGFSDHDADDVRLHAEGA